MDHIANHAKFDRRLPFAHYQYQSPLQVKSCGSLYVAFAQPSCNFNNWNIYSYITRRKSLHF